MTFLDLVNLGFGEDYNRSYSECFNLELNEVSKWENHFQTFCTNIHLAPFLLIVFFFFLGGEKGSEKLNSVVSNIKKCIDKRCEREQRLIENNGIPFFFLKRHLGDILDRFRKCSLLKCSPNGLNYEFNELNHIKKLISTNWMNINLV